jgi:hypothetical protein
VWDTGERVKIVDNFALQQLLGGGTDSSLQSIYSNFVNRILNIFGGLSSAKGIVTIIVSRGGESFRV